MRGDDDGFAAPAPGGRPWLLPSLVRMNRYLLLLLIIPFGVLYFWPNWEEQAHARQKLDTVSGERDVLAARASRLKQKLQLIRNNPEYLEIVARDVLDMKKVDEIILNFDE